MINVDKSDRTYKIFLKISLASLIFLCFMFGIVYFAYKARYINLYNIGLLLFMYLIIIITVMVSASVIITAAAFKKKRTGKIGGALIKSALRFIAPISLFIGAQTGVSKDLLRGFFIEICNIIANSSGKRYNPEEILVLLPHCLQNNECTCRITNDINNCRECGRCDIGKLKALSREYKVSFAAVTGGTAARNLVRSCNPKALVSVACERDLYSGIMDVFPIPVYGVLNERPNGPCNNTRVDVAKVEEYLKKLVE